MIDLLIRDGTVVDGTGRAPYAADVAVENGKIVEVGQLPEAHARRVIRARGKLVTPGFIDIHRHADLAAYRPGFGQPELRQGLTTIVNGNCGLSAAPIRRSRRAEIAAYLQPICGQMPASVSTDSLAAYFENQPDSPLHTGMLVGAGVRRATPWSGWRRSTIRPSTRPWSRLWETGPWGYPWAWGTPRNAFTPPRS